MRMVIAFLFVPTALTEENTIGKSSQCLNIVQLKPVEDEFFNSSVSIGLNLFDEHLRGSHKPVQPFRSTNHLNRLIQGLVRQFRFLMTPVENLIQFLHCSSKMEPAVEGSSDTLWRASHFRQEHIEARGALLKLLGCKQLPIPDISVTSDKRQSSLRAVASDQYGRSTRSLWSWEQRCSTRGNRPDLARALEFYDRWLPGTMRRITDITRTCVPQCALLRCPGDWAALPRYRRPGRSVRGDVAAPAVHGDDLPALAQQRDSAPYRDAGNAVLNGEWSFTGQPGVRTSCLASISASMSAAT